MSFRDARRHTDMTVAELHDETAFAAAGRAPPPRAAGALLPDARLLRGGRGPHAGDVPARVARRETYAARASLRAWLYRIATNACLDALEKRPQTPAAERRDHVAAAVSRTSCWRPARRGRVVERETIELAFMIAIQHLRAAAARRADPARRARLARAGLRRAARDHRGGASTRALQRARAGLKEHLPARARRVDGGGQRGGARAARALHGGVRGGRRAAGSRRSCRGRALLDAARAGRLRGPRDDRQRLDRGWLRHATEFGAVRCVLTRANRQPAVANYLQAARPRRVDVLTIADGGARVTFDVRSRDLTDGA